MAMSFGHLVCCSVTRQNPRGNGGDEVVSVSGLGRMRWFGKSRVCCRTSECCVYLAGLGEGSAIWPRLEMLFIMSHGKYNKYVLPCSLLKFTVYFNSVMYITQLQFSGSNTLPSISFCSRQRDVKQHFHISWVGSQNGKY